MSQRKRINVHIGEDQVFNDYHRVVARLAHAYSPPTGKVLEVGCGLGHVLYLLNRYGPALELYGADISWECLEKTKQRVKKVNTILLTDDGGLGIAEAKYDTCIMCHSLEHMTSPLDALRKVMSILKPGGHLILAVPNPVRPQVFISNILRRHYVNPGHVYAWDSSHWINFLENIAKLNVIEYPSDEVRVFPQSIARKLPPLKSIERNLAKLVPWWSFSNMAVIRKKGGIHLD